MSSSVYFSNCPFCSASYLGTKEEYEGFCQCKVCKNSFTLGKENTEGKLNFIELLPVIEGETFIKNGYTVENGVLKSAVIDTDIVEIPNGVVIIGNNVFKDNQKIKKVIMPNSVLYIGRKAFECCDGIREVVLPKNLLSIGESAFYQCRRLAEIKIPQTLKYIGGDAFGNCDNVTDLDIPVDMEYVGSALYRFCKKLKKAVIPNYPEIDLLAWFSDLDSLEEIVVGKYVNSTMEIPVNKIKSIKFVNTEGWSIYKGYNNDGIAVPPSELENPKKAAQFLYKLSKNKDYLVNKSQPTPHFDFGIIKLKDI